MIVKNAYMYVLRSDCSQLYPLCFLPFPFHTNGFFQSCPLVLFVTFMFNSVALGRNL